MNCKWFFVVFVSLMGATISLYAHHPSAEQYPGHAAIVTQFLSDYGFGRYRHDAVKADIWSWNLSGDYAFTSRMSLGSRIGFQQVDFSNENKRDGSGFGDLDLIIKSRLSQENSKINWLGGLSVELPTGDEEEGLGSGHVELSPFLSFMDGARPIGFHGSFAGIFSLEKDEHSSTSEVNVANPHEEREFRGHVGGNFKFMKRAYLNAVLAGELPVSGDDKGEPFLEARPEIGVSFKGSWAVSLLGQLPLTNERWFDYRTMLQIRKQL